MQEEEKDLEQEQSTEKEDVNQEETSKETESEGEPKEEETSADPNKEIQEQKEKYLRLYSEFENYRRRTSKEKLDLINTAGEGIMKALLPVLDDMDRALQNVKEEEENENYQQLVSGITLIRNKMETSLKGKGLKVMEDPKGKEMDTEFHEAITQIPAPTEELKGKVVDTVEKGYLLGDKVIRYAKVVIGMDS